MHITAKLRVMNRLHVLAASSLLAWFPGQAPAQDGLGERVYFDAFQAPLDQWETAPGVSVMRDKNTLIFKTDAVESGWLSFQQRLPLSESAKVSLSVLRTIHGKLLVQAEWFREDGSSFLATTELFQAHSDAPINKTVKLVDFLPQLPNGERPAKFRLKFWIEGQNAVVEVSQAIIHVQRGWSHPGIQLMRTYTPDDAVIEDAGVDYKTERGSLFVALTPPTETGSVIFWDRINLNATGLLMMDLESAENATVRLHALCWNERNEFLKEVPITQEITTGGVYEIPLKNHQENFPTETARLSFKIWIHGKDATMRMAGIYYGVSE